MIVLSNTKEIITVESWEDITSRAGFTSSLDPQAHELQTIIGRYAFRDWVPCGLSNCQKPHGRGYIVVTKDGRETNIGKDCGKTYFGVDFETLSNKFDRDLTEKQNREKLWGFYMRLEEVADQVTEMRVQDRGGNWVYKTSLPLIEGGKGVPAKVVRRIMEMVKTRQTVLHAVREATPHEVEQIEQAQGRRLPRPHVIEVPVAEVVGLEALYPENNLLQLLVITLEEQLKELDQLSIDALSYEDLRRWSKWVGEVDSVLERAGASINRGRLLLTQANLTPFIEAVGLNTDEVEQFRVYLNALPKN
ncbi:hypothetical protein [Caldimonas tepidiphila]|uniref:hypothetical protein n=1 Tax=Caldimonas tepidiphila TaxID=2315841 RepID=UPI000E5C34B5|nr:hypothetical protein [Caldimonas tepidiphila]